MDKDRISKLSESIETPSYVYTAAEFRERAEEVRRAFGEDVGLCFSIKANPFLLAALPQTFDYVEVCSPGELEICKALGVEPGRIIFSGVNKQPGEVADALAYGVTTVTAESMSHVEIIDECAVAMGLKCELLLRLSNESQFGMDEECLVQVVKDRGKYGGFEIGGLHYFTGTQKKKACVVAAELERLRLVIERLRSECGFEVARVEYGSGLAADYFKAEADEIEAARLAEAAEAVRSFAADMSPLSGGCCGRPGLTVEMGRFFAAPCGYYYTTVVDTKVNDGTHYAILDGGIHQLKYDGQTQGMQLPVIEHIRRGGGVGDGTRGWTLCGSLCTTADVLARNAVFTDLCTGDVLAFRRTGAYSADEGIALLLSRDMPRIYMLKEDGGLVLLRDRVETAPFNMRENI